MTDDTMRMRAEVGDGFTGPLAKLRNDLRSLSVSTRSIADGMSKDWKGVRKEFASIDSGLKRGLLPTLRGVGTVSLGVSAAVGGLAIGMRNFASGGRELKFAADQLGTSLSKLRELHNLGGVFDISGDQMNAALKTLQDNLNQLVHNWGAAYNELRGKNLGWIADDLTKAAKEGGVGAAFEKLLEDIKKIPDPVYQRQIAQLLLGGDQFVPMARELSDKIRKMAKDNSIIPPDFDKQSERYIENLKRIEQQLNVMKVEMGTPLLGYLSEVLEQIQREVRGWAKIIDQVKTKDWNGLLAEDPAHRKRILQRQLSGAQSRLKDLDEGIGDAQRSGNAGTGYADLQRRKLLEEIERLRKAVEDANKNGGLLQKQSLNGGGFGGARVMNASLGGSSGGFRGGTGSSVGAGAGAAGSGVGTAAGGSLPDVPGGVIDRTRFARELQQNPSLREKIMGIAAGENNDPRANLAVMESMMNRAAMAGTTLAAQARLHAQSGINEGGYYAGYNPGALRNPKTRAMIEKNLAAALGGSNISNYATDNASSWLAEKHKRTGGFNLQFEAGRESFFSPGSAGGRGGPRSRSSYEAWRNRIAAEAAIPMPRAAPAEIRGSARVDINLNGLPGGAQVRSGFDGLFRELNIHRGRPMQSADEAGP